MYLPEDDLRIETCWSDFKCFNVKKFHVCALVGVLIKCLYEMHGATIKMGGKKNKIQLMRVINIAI